jgi:SNF2 family DNA or RNA helicase
MIMRLEANLRYRPPARSIWRRPGASTRSRPFALTLDRKSLLVADQVGLGKTRLGMAVASEGTPALILAPPHRHGQVRDEIKKFLPAANVCCDASFAYAREVRLSEHAASISA